MSEIKCRCAELNLAVKDNWFYEHRQLLVRLPGCVDCKHVLLLTWLGLHIRRDKFSYFLDISSKSVDTILDTTL